MGDRPDLPFRESGIGEYRSTDPGADPSVVVPVLPFSGEEVRDVV
jgi:hypothetical protein